MTVKEIALAVVCNALMLGCSVESPTTDSTGHGSGATTVEVAADMMDDCVGGTPDSSALSTARSGYGMAELDTDPDNPILSLTTTLVVPAAPEATGTLFLWPGLQPSGANYLPIDNGVLQPVLTWGPTCAPNAPESSYASWWVSAQYVNTVTDDQEFHGCHGGPGMAVDEGDTLIMTMTLSGTSWSQTVTSTRTGKMVSFQFDLQGQSQNRALFAIEPVGSSMTVPVLFGPTVVTFTREARASCHMVHLGMNDTVMTPLASADGTKCCISAITLYGEAAQPRGGMIVSDTNANLAMNAYGGAVHGAFLRLVNNCSRLNPDCTWTYRDGMIFSDRDPSLAVNTYGGARVGADLRLVNNCTKSNTDCTWTYRNGMFVSDSNPDLAINAYGGATNGTGLKLNTCSQGNSDCTFTYLHTMLLSNANSNLAMNAYGGAMNGTPLKLANNCSAGNPDCRWILTKGMVLSATDSNLAMNAYGGAMNLTELKLVNNCNTENSDCTWTIHDGLLLSDTRLDLAMNAYGGARHGAVLTLVDNCSTSNSDCTWTQTQHP